MSKFDKALRALTKWLLLLAITLFVMCQLHQYGTYERGYPAIGGEALLIIIPILVPAIIYDEKRRKKAKRRLRYEKACRTSDSRN